MSEGETDLSRRRLRSKDEEMRKLLIILNLSEIEQSLLLFVTD
jgi:hypothetical protein